MTKGNVHMSYGFIVFYFNINLKPRGLEVNREVNSLNLMENIIPQYQRDNFINGIGKWMDKTSCFYTNTVQVKVIIQMW